MTDALHKAVTAAPTEVFQNELGKSHGGERLLGSRMLGCNLDQVSAFSYLSCLLPCGCQALPVPKLRVAASSHSSLDGPRHRLAASCSRPLSSVPPRLLQTQQLRIISVKCRCHLLPDFRPSPPPEPPGLPVICGLEPQPLDCPWRPLSARCPGTSPLPVAVLTTHVVAPTQDALPPLVNQPGA